MFTKGGNSNWSSRCSLLESSNSLKSFIYVYLGSGISYKSYTHNSISLGYPPQDHICTTNIFRLIGSKFDPLSGRAPLSVSFWGVMLSTSISNAI